MEDKVLVEAWWLEYAVEAGIVILGIVGYYVRKFSVKLVAKINLEETEREALNAIMAGVTDVYHEFVKDAKFASEDGKLTESEKLAARNKAITKAKELAKGKGKDFLESVARERLTNWVELAVNKMKK